MLQNWGIGNVTAPAEKVYTWYFFYLIGHPKSIVRIESFHTVVQLHAVRAWLGGAVWFRRTWKGGSVPQRGRGSGPER
jgi:hypothetical protein